VGVSGQVLEHVPRAWVWLEELARVTKPGGHVITINPVSWPYHEAPVDCWRIFPEGMIALYEHANLDVELSEYVCLESDAKRIIPGAGLDCQPLKRRFGMWFVSMFGFPIEASYDIVTVGKKK
jgi:ubiquinone/menaquinone biosynthesis C-methylase UbiE